jgi:hypothetical protein
VIVSIVELVKLVAMIQRKPTAEQAKSRRDTLERRNATRFRSAAMTLVNLTCASWSRPWCAALPGLPLFNTTQKAKR